jgi:hypothetical protein
MSPNDMESAATACTLGCCGIGRKKIAGLEERSDRVRECLLPGRLLVLLGI